MDSKTSLQIRDHRKSGWFWMDNSYLNGYAKIFGAVGTAIYVSLCRHADNVMQICFPSHALIAEELDISIKTVKKYITLFKKHRLVEAHQTKNKDGTFKYNTYTLLDKKCWMKTPEGIKVPTDTVGKQIPYRRELKYPRTVGNVVPTKETHKNKKTHRRIPNNMQKGKNISSSLKGELPITRGMEVNKVIDVFYQKNPCLGFDNKTQRAAVTFLLGRFGFTRTLNAAKIAVKVQGQEFAPVITTPYQLKAKFTQLHIFCQRFAAQGPKVKNYD